MDEQIVSIIRSALPKMMDYGTRLAGAIIVFIVGKLLIKFVLNIIQRFMRKAEFDQTIIDFGSNIVNIGLLFLVLLMSANTLGFDTSSFLAVVGAAGLAIGLALKGSLDNVASGFMVVALRQIRVGDYIEIAGKEGFVHSIKVFNTTLRTRDSKTVIIPNSVFTSDSVTNYSTVGRLRAQLVFGISYEDDIPKAKDVIYKVLKANARVLETPEPFVGVKTMNESSIDFDVHAWVNVEDYWAVRWELTEVAKMELEAAGITIPFPQRDVHFYPHEDPLRVQRLSSESQASAQSAESNT